MTRRHLDPEMDATRIALGADSMRLRTMRLLDLERRSLDVAELEEMALSSGESLLAAIAISCWTGRGDFGDLATRGGLTGKRALTALAVRMGLCDHGSVTLDPADYLDLNHPPSAGSRGSAAP